MRVCLAIVCALGSASLIGCGGEAKHVRVTGTITLDGQPYEGALVEFTPDPGNAAITGGRDITGSTGNYLIRSSSGRTGVTPGKYTVTISPAPPQSPTASMASTETEPTPEVDPGQLDALGAAGGQLKAEDDQADRPTGTFEAEVGDQPTELDFDVKT